MKEEKDSNIESEEDKKAENKEIKPPKPLTRKFVILTSILAGLIVACALAMGIILPKSDNAIEHGLYALKEKSKSYTEAKAENDALRKKNEELNKQLEERTKDLETFHSSQNNLDKITESNTSLESERDILKDEVSKKKARLDSINAAESAYAQRIITWTSGDYTVGEDIATGKYMITGTGSIAVAKNGKSRVNKMLTSNGELLTLSDGERIRIDGSAKLVPQR